MTLPIDPNLLTDLAERRVRRMVVQNRRRAAAAAADRDLAARIAVHDASPTRARIIAVLTEQRMSASMLSTVLGHSTTSVRRQLRILADDGVIRAVEARVGTVWEIACHGGGEG